MIPKAVLVYLLLLAGTAISQKYYLTGRPFGLERNNAIKEIGNRWGLEIAYAGGDIFEALGIDSVNSVNQKVADQRGENWLTEFYLAVDKEEMRHQKIREGFLNTSKRKEDYTTLIHHHKGKKYILLEVSIPGEGAALCMSAYMCRLGRKISIRPYETCKIPYAIPQNGLRIN